MMIGKYVIVLIFLNVGADLSKNLLNTSCPDYRQYLGSSLPNSFFCSDVSITSLNQLLIVLNPPQVVWMIHYLPSCLKNVLIILLNHLFIYVIYLFHREFFPIS